MPKESKFINLMKNMFYHYIINIKINITEFIVAYAVCV
jgi:hypothetical protein